MSCSARVGGEKDKNLNRERKKRTQIGKDYFILPSSEPPHSKGDLHMSCSARAGGEEDKT